MIKDRIPYTYLITEKETGKRYYGAAYRKDCCPAQLGVSYFSSSNVVEPLCRKDPNNFIFEVRQIFDSGDPTEARKWEAKFLSRIDAARKGDWFNKHNGNEKFLTSIPGPNKGKKFSEETKKKLSASHKGLRCGVLHPMYGKKHSEATKAHWSKIRKGKTGPNKGRIFSVETRLRMSESQKKLYASGYINPNKGVSMSEQAKAKRKAYLSLHGGTMKGKHHSEETKKKIAISKNRNQVSEHFSKLIWVTNGRENRRIQPTEQIAAGWKRGRASFAHKRPRQEK